MGSVSGVGTSLAALGRAVAAQVRALIPQKTTL